MLKRAEPQTRRGLVLVCIAMGMFMVAIEATIVSTAMPSIVAKLGGFQLYSWVFTAFLLTQATTTVMFGKLADLYGRRPVLVCGTVVFLAGSVLCGFAWSMGSLIAFRLLQGLGAGSIQPVMMTLLGDLYTPEERIGVQGYLSAVWGVSAIIGPLLGALVVQYWSWPWIFWINVPIGLIMIVGMLTFLHEKVEHKNHALDLAGAGLFFLAISSLLFVLTQGAQRPAWAIGFGLLFLVTVPALIWQERRASEPMIPLDLWARPLISTCGGAAFGAGMIFMGVTSFLPVYLQGVMGRTATQAGLAITMMSLGWPLANTVARRVFRGTQLPLMGRVGGLFLVAGTLSFLLMNPQGGLVIPAIGSFIIGAGMGLLINSSTILVQSSVDWAQRGVATSSVIFSRTLGGMLGAALLGGVLNGALQLFSQRGGASLDRVRHLLDQAGPGSIQGADLPLLRHVLDQGLQAAFVTIVALALVTLAVAWRIGRHAPAD